MITEESQPASKKKSTHKGTASPSGKATSRKNTRYDDDDSEENFDMVDSNLSKKKPAKPDKKSVGRKEDLDRSNMSYRSFIDRNSVKSTVSRKRQMTIEDYIG